MDNRAGEMEVFVAVADTGGFSTAGKRLDLSPSAVSKLIGRLEDRLGVRLLVRSTRAVKLTQEGEMYLGRARQILDDISEAERIIGSGGTVGPRGRLRVNSTVGFGERFLIDIVPKFLNEYPGVELDLSLNDGIIGLIEERADIAIRSGVLSDSSLKAQKLMESSRVVVASPSYLAKHGRPETPKDLADHNCLGFNFTSSFSEWPFRNPGSSDIYRVPVTGNSFANSGMIVRRLCLNGLGLARLGRFHVQTDIEEGTLVPVLEDFNPQDVEVIHAIYAGHDYLASRVRAFLDFVKSEMRGRRDGNAISAAPDLSAEYPADHEKPATTPSTRVTNNCS